MNQTYSAERSSYSLFGISMILATLALFPFAGTAHADNDRKDSNLKAGTGVEINIGGNGNVLVRGAKVTSVSSSTVNANTNYGSSILGWTVKTDGDTEFSANKGSSTGLAQIAVGDIISFRGSLDQAVSGLTVNANIVKDWTQAESKKTYSGMVTSINTTLNSFTLSSDGSTSSPQATTVQTNSATKFKLSNGNTASFADIFLNAKVKVMGMWNASSSVLTATSVDVG
ncbi:MAG: DUF5666 domain-containing protein, partial [Minisyncoccia bacterium]